MPDRCPTGQHICHSVAHSVLLSLGGQQSGAQRSDGLIDRALSCDDNDSSTTVIQCVSEIILRLYTDFTRKK